MKPVQESDKSLDQSILHKSSMRLSYITSKFVCVVLETSVYFKKTRLILLEERLVTLLVLDDP